MFGKLSLSMTINHLLNILFFDRIDYALLCIIIITIINFI